MNQQISPEEYERLVKEQCPFCKIIDGKIPAKIVYEDDVAVAFLDINPASPGHTLVVPKKHYAVLPQMSDSEIGHIFSLVRNISGLLFEVTQRSSKDKPAGVNIIQNNGAAAGQQVPHVHIHVIPRLEGDNVIQPWQPKQMDENQLNQYQELLKANIRPVEKKKAGPKAISVPGLTPAEPTATQEPVKEEPKPEPKKEKKPAKKDEKKGVPVRKPRRP